MRSYAESGDRSHALQAYKRCEKAIRDELDVEPETTTVELRDQIANGGNTARPIAAISALAADSPASPDTANITSDPDSSTDHSIAVLPFDNLSGDPEQEYFSDGITDSIILNLSLFPGLNVKSRNTSFAFKQQMKSPGEISQELKVDYIVEGSVRKSQHRIRITVQLIEAGSGNQVWGNRYDSEIEDLFELEENLSRTIATTVTGQIESDLRRIAIAKGAAEQQAYDLLLSGIYHAYRFNRQDTAVAIEKLNQCLAQDPDNLRAHVMLYGCHSMGYLERWTEDHQASFRLAEKHIRKALKSGPESGMVQVVFGEFLIFKGDLEEADLHLDKALELNPNDPDALITKALKLELQGQFSEALELAERVIALDPYHPWAEWELAVSQFYCGHYETALETLTKSRTSPGFMQVYIVMSHIKLGNIELARQALQKFLQTCRENMLSMPQTLDEWLAYTQANYHYVDPLFNQDIIDCLVQAGLEESLSPDRAHPSDEHSIAVLPFDNLSGDPGQEYFSDGITESIILNLSLFPGLHVKSRNSSFAFKQQLKSIGEISEELEVDYIVEGSIRKTATRVRVTVQLVEATSGNQVWGKRYDAEIEDLFDLEEDLSRTIAATVTGQIESDLQRISITRGASDLQAYDLLLNGTYHLDLADRKSVETAIKEFKQCLLKDPDNAVAHAQLFYCYDLIVLDHWTEDVEDARELATEHLLKAVSLRPDLPFVQVAYADHLMFFQQFDEAEHQLKLALDANPNDTEAIAYRAVMLSLQGQAEPALKQAELSLRLDPYHPWAKWIKSESLFFCDRYADCIANIADTDNAPAFIQIYAISSYIRQGKLDEAKTALKHFLGFCQENMLSMPDTVEGWYDYFRINAPFTDPAKNRGVIDNLIQAGLEEELASTYRQEDSAQQPGILVLPFSNLSGDPQQEYFSDGITDSLIVNLSSFSGLTVKSRHTSFAHKNIERSIDEIATELEVQYIVEGSIRKFGDKVRITVQLSDTESGNQLWGKRFESSLEELFAIEEELVQTIAGTISGRIGREIKSASILKPANSLRSYDYLMRAWHHMEKF
ncbi:MAG: tetratricopeptide repeat protein, partial [Gammaproteobacteria bacterium]